MIPDFAENGNLPSGIHCATLEEIAERFGNRKFLKRHSLTVSVQALFDAVKDEAVGVYVDGSYVTSKLRPNDVDLIVIFPRGFEFSTSTGRRVHGFQRKRKDNHLHIWPYVEGRDDHHIRQRLRDFTHDYNRGGIQKGIIYVEMRDDQEQRPIEANTSKAGDN